MVRAEALAALASTARHYQPPETLAADRNSAVFMELALEGDRSDA